jgi:hypothetical protein
VMADVLILEAGPVLADTRAMVEMLKHLVD